eukprot:scaffold9371_cov211-Amphora_coffeaeformis.AAC.10
MFSSLKSREAGYARPFLILLLLLLVFAFQVDAWVAPTTTAVVAGRSFQLSMAASSCWANEQAAELIERFGSVWEPQMEKVVAYENLQLSPSKDRILDAALDYIQQTTGMRPHLLIRKRWKIRLPSRRTTVACFGRILAEMEAGRLVMGDESGDATEESSSSLSREPDERARQNLNYLLKLLSTYPKGVWGLEGEMIQTAGIANFGQDFGTH